jgi:hypothetical protein
MAELREEDLLAALKRTFGHDAFRGVQESAVRGALSGRDALVLMPTGAGKSLCYALPSAVGPPGLVIVVSPLIGAPGLGAAKRTGGTAGPASRVHARAHASPTPARMPPPARGAAALMQDQVASLTARGLAADYLASVRTEAERRAVLRRLDAAAAQPAAYGGGGGGGGRDEAEAPLALLYVTPELLATEGFSARLRALRSAAAVKLVAVDEAHCIRCLGVPLSRPERGSALVLLCGRSCAGLGVTAPHVCPQNRFPPPQTPAASTATTSGHRTAAWGSCGTPCKASR